MFLVPFLKNTCESGLAYDLLKKIYERMPRANKIIPAKNIALPYLENIILNTDNEILQNNFIALLQKSMDNTQKELHHPAFPQILGQLSVDEIIVLYFILKNNEIKKITEMPKPTLQKQISINSDIKLADRYEPGFLFVNNTFDIIISHLYSLGLIQHDEKSNNIVIYPKTLTVTLNKFGKQFITAYLSEEAEELIKNNINQARQ